MLSYWLLITVYWLLLSIHHSSFRIHHFFDTLSDALLRSKRSSSAHPIRLRTAHALSHAAAAPSVQASAGDGARVRHSRALALVGRGGREARGARAFRAAS